MPVLIDPIFIHHGSFNTSALMLIIFVLYKQPYSLLQDLPSLPRLNPERQRQVRVLWPFPSRQMSEQPPAFPNWSTSHAWLRTAKEGNDVTKPDVLIQYQLCRRHAWGRMSVCSAPGGWRLWWYTCSAPPLSTRVTTW